MDRIDALLAEAHMKAKENGTHDDSIETGAVIEGPMPPRSRLSSPSSDSQSRSPSRRYRGRSPKRDFDDDRGRYERSPQRKRRKMRSNERGYRSGSRSPSRSPPRDRDRYRDRSGPRRHRGGRGHYYDDEDDDRRGYRSRSDRRGSSSMDDRRRRRSPSPDRRRDSREQKDIKYAVVREERAARTVFVQNLPLDITERQIEEWFENHDAPVRDVQFVVDKYRKFKGFAYIEFYQKSSVPLVLELNGKMCFDRPISIEPSDKPSNSSTFPAASPDSNRHTSPQHQDAYSNPNNLLRLYLGNLDYSITFDMVKELVSQFGPLESLKVPTEPNGVGKGHAFIQYWNKESALEAFHKLNATTLANRPLRCDFTKDARLKDPDLPPSPPFLSNTKVTSTIYPGSQNAANIPATVTTASLSATQLPSNQDAMGSLDDEHMKATNQNIHNLIQRLAASSTGNITTQLQQQQQQQQQQILQQQIVQLLQHEAPLVPVIDKSALPSPGTPTRTVCLKNLFDPSTETDPNFDKEIELDVKEEASTYGNVLHIFVDKTSFGDVYLKFDTLSGSAKAVEVMHGRFFAGRLVRVEYIPEETYDQKFNL